MSAKNTSIDEAELIRLYVAGQNQLSLARHFECSRPVVNRILREHGIAKHSLSAVQLGINARHTPERRAEIIRNAQTARRGQKDTVATLCRRAQTRQAKQLGVSPGEELLRVWLKQRGIESIPQLAIGPYNADLGAAPVAVEVFGGCWHGSGRHAARTPDRCRYLFDQGWNLIVVWADLRRHRFTPGAADYITAFVEQSRRDPAFRCQHRVIWCDGQETSTCGLDVDHIADVPARG